MINLQFIIPQQQYAQQIYEHQLIDDYTTRKELINGTITPILIYGEVEPDFDPKYLTQEVQMTHQQKLLKTLPSFRDSNYHIEDNSEQEVYFERKDNSIAGYLFLPICISEQYCHELLQMRVILRYNQKHEFKEQLIPSILRNEIPTDKQHKPSSVILEQTIKIINPLTLTYQYHSTTSRALLQFTIQKHETIEILNTDVKMNESIMIWKDVNIQRQVPQQMLKHIQIEKKYINQEEGFVEIALNWPAMLENDNESSQLPMRRQSVIAQTKNPILCVTTPSYIIFKQEGCPFKSYFMHKLQWTVKPVNQIGAEVMEAVKYESEDNQYLALHIKVINYTTQELDVQFIPPAQIFGKKVKQSKQSEPYVVLGICLSQPMNLGLIEPCKSGQCILRVQLINEGILNLQQLHFKIGEKSIMIDINFLYSQ